LDFLRFPLELERRKRRIAATKRKDWMPNKHTRIRGQHFTTGRFNLASYIASFLTSFKQSNSSGKPNDDPLHVDYVPSIFVFKINAKSRSERLNERHVRLQQRREKASELKATTAAAETFVYMSEVESPSLSAADTANVYTQTDSPSTVAQGNQVCAPRKVKCAQVCQSVIQRCAQTDFVNQKASVH